MQKRVSSRIVRVALTGGPCAGKTTALARIREVVGECGVPVLMIPEVATDFIDGGITPAVLSVVDFQEQLIRHQIERENRWMKAAFRMKAPVVLVLSDRGVMDARAYMSERDWIEVRARLRLSNDHDLCDVRYDGVVFLRSAACGAEQFYTTANNTARTETLSEARALDARTEEVWLRHEHLVLIGNETGFEEKVRRAAAAVCHMVGIPEPLEIERKFEVSPLDLAAIPVPSVTFRILQDYLVNAGDEERRLRARGSGDAWVYTETSKRPHPGSTAQVRIETERIISAREYLNLLFQGRLPGTQQIKKERTAFVWQNRRWTVDRFEAPRSGLFLAEVELQHKDEQVEPPPFLKVIADRTENPAFRNSAIAQSSAA